MKLVPDDGVIRPHVQRDLPALGLHDPAPQPLVVLSGWAGFLQVPWPAPVWKVEPMRDYPVQRCAVAAELAPFDQPPSIPRARPCSFTSPAGRWSVRGISSRRLENCGASNGSSTAHST